MSYPFIIWHHERLEAICAGWCIHLRIDWPLYRGDGSDWCRHTTNSIIARFTCRWIFGQLRVVGICAVLGFYFSEMQDITEVGIYWFCRDRGFGVGILFMRNFISATLMVPKMPPKSMIRNAGWTVQFRYHGGRQSPRVPELWTRHLAYDMTILWKMPWCSSGRSEDRIRPLGRREVEVLVGDGEHPSQRLVFGGVESFRVTYYHACASDMIQAYDQVVDLSTTPWFSEVEQRLRGYADAIDGLRHLRFYLDDGP